MQYKDSYMAGRVGGVQFELRLCSTKIVTWQDEGRVCSMRRGCAVPR